MLVHMHISQVFILQIDKVSKLLSEKSQKVQITIARDGDSGSSMVGSASRAPNIQLKTPIVVKRIEPGKAPTLSSLPTASKGSQQRVINISYQLYINFFNISVY